ncbi:ABC transporter ATP-binding protein [Nitratireductor sp. StC3]|uniref:ABC transporter ATP-binding protein n=1 Tax=Nitratireductor sp. StC3 TaxID=2126741 RepID=UPI000D0E1251|nr:ABC transporter ATP-binding protein [Nitratireductor sp. StC3]PSM15826.1 ABC transporter ATP-binding protein [Nitratireductor sp. StC3]
MSQPLLEIDSLEAGYGLAPVLHNVMLSVGVGEAIALLGANGAGKTTLMRSIMGLGPRVSGSILLDGQPIDHLKSEARVRRGLGYAPEGRRVFPGLTVVENIEVASNESKAMRKIRTARMFDLFPQLVPKRDTPAWQLSGGQQQMLAIARALMTAPRLLLLDEPSLGLSPLLASQVISNIRNIVAEGTSVLLAEQNVAKALEVCDRAYILRLGEMVVSGTSKSLRESSAVRDAFLGA